MWVYSFWIWYFLVGFYVSVTKGAKLNSTVFCSYLKRLNEETKVGWWVFVNYNLHYTERVKPTQVWSWKGTENRRRKTKTRRIKQKWSRFAVSFYLFWKSAHFVGSFYASGCLIFVLNLSLSRVLGFVCCLLALIISVF